MVSVDPTEIAWAAGLFEGEGYIANAFHGKRYTRRLSLVSTDLDVVDKFHKIVGTGKRWTPRKYLEHHKLQYTWYAGSWEDIVPILIAFVPHLCERRRTAALELLTNTPRGKEPVIFREDGTLEWTA